MTLEDGSRASFACVVRVRRSRASFALRVVPAQPKLKPVIAKATPTQKNGVSIITFPESLVEVSDVREFDGGIVLTGRNEKGERVEVLLSPER